MYLITHLWVQIRALVICNSEDEGTTIEPLPAATFLGDIRNNIRK